MISLKGNQETLHEEVKTYFEDLQKDGELKEIENEESENEKGENGGNIGERPREN